MIVELRNAIVDRLKTVEGLVEVRAYGGRFTAEALARYAVRAPAALVVPIAVAELARVGTRAVATTRWAIVLVAPDRDEGRDTFVLRLVDAAVALLGAGERWGLDGAQVPREIRADNLFGERTDRAGLAVWAVAWSQAIELEDGMISWDSLDDLNRVDVQIDAAPKDGVVDAEDLIEVEGP